MNRTIKSLILAAGVAAATLTVTVPVHADPIPNGPGTIGIGPIVDPEPQPEPKPVPAGPGDIANPPHCTHGCGGSDGPKDIANPAPAPADEPPTDVINNGPLLADEPELDQGCSTGCDLPEKPTSKPAAEQRTEAEVVPVLLHSNKPSVVEQLQLGEVVPSATEDHGINPLFFVLGGAGAGALILAAVARRRRRQAQELAPQA